MRIPIILALIVIVTLPKDIHGLADDLSTQLTTTSAAVTQFLDRGDEPLQVADLAGEASGTSVR